MACAAIAGPGSAPSPLLLFLAAGRAVRWSALGKRACALRLPPTPGRVFAVMLFIAALGSSQGCHELVRSQGTRSLQANPSQPQHGPYVIVFAIDGAGYGQFMNAIGSGRATYMGSLLGKATGANLYQHGYSVPNTITIMPSCTTPAWSSIMTGRPPADTGVAGDEFFVREENRFYAPIPLSTREPDDFIATIDNDLIGQILRVPTVYQRIRGASDVALLYVYHGATRYSTLGGAALLELAVGIVEGTFTGATLRESIAAPIDRGSTAEVSKVIRRHGIPKLLVVYFPGVDLFTHGAPDPLPMQTQYLINNIDADVGNVLAEYSHRGVLNDTYVVFTSDHGHTPVLKDQAHDLAFRDGGKLFELLEKAGFRVRRPTLRPAPGSQDYQVVMADEGFAAYLYLANRSTCVHAGALCDWRKLPRFRQDLLPLLRVIHQANRRGKWVPEFKGAVDLIFSRDYGSGMARHTPAFEVFDGRRLIPIHTYLVEHPRPDLVEVTRRMNWLGEGPYGDRAGDIVLLGKASMSLPIQDRFYFSHTSYYAWHGSLTLQDGHIPLVVARSSASGDQLKALVNQVVHNPPSALDVAPLIEMLLAH